MINGFTYAISYSKWWCAIEVLVLTFLCSERLDKTYVLALGSALPSEQAWLFAAYLCCAGSSLLRGPFSSCGAWGLLSSCGVLASPCGGFSCCRAQSRTRASVVTVRGWARMLWGTWDLSRPGLKPMSFALVSGFFTTEPPGKPWGRFIILGSILLDYE